MLIVYVALYDEPARNVNTTMLGVFSTEDMARAACQEAEDEDGRPPRLAWNNDGTAETLDGIYLIYPATLDKRSA
jgi:hypothetical protein